MLEQNLLRYGLAFRCGSVRASEVPVLALENGDGRADLARSLADEHGVPVIEGVSAAVRLAETLVALGLATSKLGGWAAPRPKARGRVATADARP